jgi:putative DNA primase/helicase
VSVGETISDFLDFMRCEGVEPLDTARFCQEITSGEVIRFDCAGEKRGRKNGWAKLYLDDRPAGAFGNWKLGINRRWSSGTSNELSAEERRALRTEWETKKAERDQLRVAAQEEAVHDAVGIWNAAEKAKPSHPYIARKRIGHLGLRQQGDTLLVPMYDDEGRLWNLQRIKPDGEKRFLFGARVDGLFTVIGDFTDAEEAVIGEGYATMDSVYKASGLPCIVAFNTANLLKVARIWAERRPDLRFIIFADDDEATAQKSLAERGIYKNPGIEAAEAAAIEIGARVAYPPRRAVA